jgi:hypothetical protein
MPLSSRALSYLETLRRRPAVAVEQVADAIRRAGCEPYPAWLDFHERYAGYEDPLGRETAILGIVHAESFWLEPGEASVDQDREGRWSVVCAEVHGTFDYRLHDDGHFTSFGGGGPTESFDIKIEQDAVFRETCRRDGRAWTVDMQNVTIPPNGLDELRAATGAELVPEASDKFSAIWRGLDVWWKEDRGGGARLVLWRPEEARERMAALLRR